jgi:hypothetical protein
LTIPDVLYHFTCRHGRKDIGSGSNCLLLPHLHPWIGQKLLWLTTEALPDRDRTGLTMRHQPCDRMAFRYVVSDTHLCRLWLDSYERSRLDADQLYAFEHNDERGVLADAAHWWISSVPIRARLDRGWSLTGVHA